MNKKGAIELSVTAIVILILAIVILGLGLGFIRGMFGKVSDTFEQQIAAEPEPVAPSTADPLTLSREAIISRAGETEAIKVGVYNPSNIVYGASFTLNASCRGFAAMSPQTNWRVLPPGRAETFTMLVNIPTTQAEGAYLCSAFLFNGSMNISRTDFTIRIRR